jgi:hypothetical protein
MLARSACLPRAQRWDIESTVVPTWPRLEVDVPADVPVPRDAELLYIADDAELVSLSIARALATTLARWSSPQRSLAL